MGHCTNARPDPKAVSAKVDNRARLEAKIDRLRPHERDQVIRLIDELLEAEAR